MCNIVLDICKFWENFFNSFSAYIFLYHNLLLILFLIDWLIESSCFYLSQEQHPQFGQA